MSGPDNPLLALRQRYLQGLPARMQGLLEVLMRLESDPTERTALEAVRAGFHGFSGTGRGYGCEELSEIGLRGEAIALAALESAAPPAPDRLRELRAEAEALGDAVRAVRATEPAAS